MLMCHTWRDGEEKRQRPAFKQHQEWQFDKRVARDRPRYVQADGHPGARALEAWRTTAPPEQPWRASDASVLGDPSRHHPEALVPFEKALERKHGVSGGMFAWLMGGAESESERRGREARDRASRAGGAPEADAAWQGTLRDASAAELCELLRACAADDRRRAYDVANAARALIAATPGEAPGGAPRNAHLRRPSVEASPIVTLVDGGFAHSLVASLGAFPEHEGLQCAGCELLGLLASEYWGFEQRVFDSGAVDACLAAIRAWAARELVSEDVLGAAFNTLNYVCAAEEVADKKGCARKQAAVEKGALEVIHEAMGAATQRWVQQAGKLAIGCLCKGSDKQGQERRKRAHALFKLNK